MNIWFGSGENAELSNLAARPFTVNGRRYLSVEHAYQTLKGGVFDEATFLRYTRAGVKLVGRYRPKTENGWNIELMRKLILLSFLQNPVAAEVLLATGDAELTHKQDRGVWRIEFPRLLMHVRAELASR